MTPPDDQVVDVALDAMRSDADVWKAAADGLNKPTSAIDELALTPADVSVWAAEHGFDSTYEQARVAIREMLVQAQDYFGRIGRNLESAADQYESDDARAAEKLNKISSDMGSV